MDGDVALRGPRVSNAMLRNPQVLPATATLEQARSVLVDHHVHMVLLTADGRPGSRLVGTLVRDDLPTEGSEGPARTWARLEGRVVGEGRRLDQVHRAMLVHGLRRLAVVDAGGRCVGLLCLKRHGRGFCTDADVCARQVERRAGAA